MQEVMEANGLAGGVYVEPYAGGAGIAVSLLLCGAASRIVLNDVDPAIYRFWKSVTEHNAEFVRAVEGAELTIEEWDRQHEVQMGKFYGSEFETGFSTFYLNRTNRSGILDGGPIGGKRQGGRYRMDARFNKEALVDRIEAIGAAADRITLYCSDAAYFLGSYLPLECRTSDTLVYADPPYYGKGCSLYLDHYGPEGHAEVASIMRGLEYRWILSYDDVPEIRELYRWAESVEFGLPYSAAHAHMGRELFYHGENTLLPDGDVVPSRAGCMAPAADLMAAADDR